MFGKKKKTTEEKPEQAKTSIHVQSMPSEFYGGKNPSIYTSSQQSKDPGSVAVESDASFYDTTSKGARLFSFFKSRRFVIIVGSVLFLIAVGLISWYYIDQARRAIPKSSQAGTSQEEIQTTPEVDIPVTSAESTSEIVTSEEFTTDTQASTVLEMIEQATSSLSAPPIEFPTSFLIDAPDLDNDTLSDREEELFGTDAGIQDTDEDGFSDGVEIENLYNPKGTAPLRIIDSGLVKEYINPIFKYRLYYPSTWEVGAVDPRSQQVLLSTFTGDYIEIRAVEKKNGESFSSWFGRNATGERYTDLKSILNPFGERGLRRSDHLVAYFESEEIVFVLVYHPGTTGTIPYRHVMELVYQSFRSSLIVTEIPEQVIQTTSTVATTTPVATTTQ